MGENLVKIKNNKKSVIYESDNYRVKISDLDGFFYKKNGDNYVGYDPDLEDGEYRDVKAAKLEITNKSTGKTSQKRCYQGYNVIEDVQSDLNNGKKQFAGMFNKIDKN